jgi:O-antigen ligase
MSRLVVRHFRLLIIAGVFATQSRGAFLGLVACIAIYAIRHERARQRAPIFSLTVALVLITISVVTLKDESKNNPRFNGVDLRVNTIDNAFNDVWAVHPFTGGGLKYFQASFDQVGGAEQIFVAELAEAGIIGLLGLLVLLATTWRVLYRRRDPVGEAALLVFVLMCLYALTAAFWVAGTLTLPMLMVGLAVGDERGIAASNRASARTPAAS